MTHPKGAEAERNHREERTEEEEAAMEFVDVYEPLKGGEDEDDRYALDHEGEGEEDEEEEEEEEVEEMLTRTVAARRQRDKRTRFEMDERRPAGATALTETMSSDTTFASLQEDNQSHHKIKPYLNSNTEDLRYQIMERKLERLEKRLEAYEGLQRKLAKNRVAYQDDDHDSMSRGGGGRGGGGRSTDGGGADTQQLIEFFLTEMDKQNAVIAQMRANQRVLEQKLEESHRKTHRFHHEQLQRMSKFQEVVQMMNAEFVQGSMLRDEEKALEKNHQDKKTKAVRRALDEQLSDLKNETSHQRRRLEIKFEKKLVDLATENQLLKAENLELRDEVNKLVMAARSTKRTVRVLSDEVIKLKRAVGAAPNPEVEEALRLSGIHKPTSAGDGPSSYAPSYGGDSR